MALIAEEIVEEWLNRQGFFTIRGIKLGNDEIDLLAVKLGQDGVVECRHIEVQASIRPVSYISRVPKEIQKIENRAANSASRSDSDLIKGVEEWVYKKFKSEKKEALRRKLYPGNWSSELVLNNVKKVGKDKVEKEVALIEGQGIKIIRLQKIIDALATTDIKKFPVKSAAGADLIDLILMGAGAKLKVPELSEITVQF